MEHSWNVCNTALMLREQMIQMNPEIADKFQLTLPDEYFRRVGQSMAVASLPEM